MEQERFDKLFFGSEFMGADLLATLKNFHRFVGNDIPVVTVLCTDQRLLSQMDKLTSERNNINYHVCGTFDDTTDAVEKAFWSDAVIVDTLALKIAPEGLYKVTKELEILNKDVYFILSGWEALPKTNELCWSKLAQVDNEFPFLRIKTCKNVFVKEREGFSFIEDVLEEYAGLILDNFNFNHVAQIEAIYKVLRKKVRAFRLSVCDEIQKEQSLILNYQSILRAKQGRYELTITHPSVMLSEVPECMENNLREFDLDEVFYLLETEMSSAKESYLENPQEVERKAKLFVCRKFIGEIDHYLEEINNNMSLSSETRMQVNGIVNDLAVMTATLKKCRFITGESFDTLVEVTTQTDKLMNCIEKYNNSVYLIWAHVKEMLEPKVMSFRYEEFSEGFVSQMLGNLKSIAKDIKRRSRNAFDDHKDSGGQEKEVSELEEDIELNEDEIEELLKSEKVEDAKWEFFCEETQRMLDDAKDTFFSLLRRNSSRTIEDINIQSQNTVREYFCSVIKCMDIISQRLSKLLSEYGRDDI